MEINSKKLKPVPKSEEEESLFDWALGLGDGDSRYQSEMEEMKKNSKYMKAQDVAPDNDSDAESEKEKSGKTLIGSKKTKIVTEPKVDYQK